MNRYGLPLATPSKQTLLPAMTTDGRVHGFYPIAETTFTGTETEFTVVGMDKPVPLQSVTLDGQNAVNAYMAAVWPAGLAHNNIPWACENLIANNEGQYSWYSMATQTWMHHFGRGLVLSALANNLAPTIDPATETEPPVVEPNEPMNWQASLDYRMMAGNCAFFDFNWITVFKAKTSSVDPLRIVVVENPPMVNGMYVMKAVVVGIPTATAAGVVYDTIRIMRLADDILPGDFVFKFKVYDTTDKSTDVTFTLTVL